MSRLRARWENTSSIRALHVVKSRIKENSQVLKNMTWLSVLQVANYLIPLLIIPYIVRVLGVELFGKVSYAQNVVSYFTLIVNFGFEYSATRRIAIWKHDKDRMNLVFWSVMRQKTILLFVSFVCLLILYLCFPRIHNDINLYAIIFMLNVGVVLFPTWFFQGIEDMGKMAVFNVLIKTLGLLLTVAFVHSASEYLLYPLFTSAAYVICGVVAMIYVLKHYGIAYVRTRKAIRFLVFKEGFPVFLNNLFVSLYTTANMTILGFFVSDVVIGYYSGAHKIIMAVLMFTSTPINMALYPNISRKFAVSKEQGIAYLKNVAKIVILFSTIVSILVYICAPLLVRLILGVEFVSSIDMLRIFSVLPFLVTMASLFTVQGLYGIGLQKYAPWVGCSIGVFCIVLNFVMIPKFGMYGTAFSWIIAQALELMVTGIILKVYFNKQKNR